ncbi:MAG: Ig-like domain-containing protein [Actinomycetota bacterium]
MLISGRLARLAAAAFLAAGMIIFVAAPAAVALGPTTTSVSSSTNPSSVGQNVTFSATVQAVTVPPPLLVVTFFDGTSLLGISVLVPQFGTFCGCVPTAHSVATFSTNGLSQGLHTIRAVYAGDGDDGPSTGSMTQTVTAIATTTTLSAVPNPSVFGQGVTLSAAVATVPPGVRTPAGQLQFQVDGADAGPALTLDGSGNASTPISGLVVGGHTVTAAFTSSSTDALDSVGTLAGLEQVIKADTATDVTSSASPAVYGQPVTLSASPSAVAPGAGTPTGTVTFTDGPAALGTAPVTAGHATVTTASLAVGSHGLVASYNGDGNFKPSSGSFTQLVGKASTVTTVISSANPSVYGQPVTFTVTECAAPPSDQPALPPSGSVVFTIDGSAAAFDTQVLVPSSGIPSCSSATSAATAALSVGPPAHSVSVAYSGDGNYLGSNGVLLGGQTVNKDPTTTAIVSAHNPAFFGDPLTFTVTVLAAPPGAGTPSGTVTFTDGSTILGLAALTGGQATFTDAGLQVGTHSIVATYSGDGNFLASSSTALSQQVRCTTTVTGVVNGGLTVSTGSTCLQGATVNGGITVMPGAALSMRSTTVNGTLTSSGAKALTSCGSTTQGATSIQRSGGFVLLGDAGDDGYACAGNTFWGTVTLNANAGQLEVGGNDVAGGLAVIGTSGAGPDRENTTSEIEANRIRGNLDCSGNTPAPTNDGQANTVTGQRTGQCSPGL